MQEYYSEELITLMTVPKLTTIPYDLKLEQVYKIVHMDCVTFQKLFSISNWHTPID